MSCPVWTPVLAFTFLGAIAADLARGAHSARSHVTQRRPFAASVPGGAGRHLGDKPSARLLPESPSAAAAAVSCVGNTCPLGRRRTPATMLVLAIGDLHIPLRKADLPPKFKARVV